MNTKQRNSIAIAFLVLLGSFVVIYFLIGPKVKTSVDQQNQLQSDVTAKTARLDTVNQLRVPLKHLETSMTNIESIGLPKGTQLPDLIEQVDHIMLSQTDFKLVNFDPSLAKTAAATTASSSVGGAAEEPFTLTVSGKSDKLSNLLGLINNNIRPLYVKSVIIATSSDANAQPGDVTITLAIVAYNSAGGAAK